MRRNSGPFIKTASRGSVYCTKNGRFWIRRDDSGWVLLERDGRWITLGKFGSLAGAIAGFGASGK